MRLHLDTHAFLWFVLNGPLLSVKARALIADPANTVLLSLASCWEIAIKMSIGKYSLAEPYDVFLRRELAVNKINLLDITVTHTGLIAGLPFHHKDPFDRMLVAQAMAEQIPIVSADSALDAYAIARLW